MRVMSSLRTTIADNYKQIYGDVIGQVISTVFHINCVVKFNIDSLGGSGIFRENLFMIKTDFIR